MLSSTDLTTLRSIASARDDHNTIKRLLATTSWDINEDEPSLGFLRIFIPDPIDKCYRLIIGYDDPNRPPYSLLTFYLFPDSEAQIPAFNAAFNSTAETLIKFLGAPSLTGQTQLSFRNSPYSYRRWSLPEGEFTLVQGEFDIQDGLDISLWIEPPGTTLDKTLNK